MSSLRGVSSVVAAAWGLTLPSRGRATSGFAGCRPPLMSNVRRPMNARPLVDMEAYCAALGMVAMQWSTLEHSVHRLLWRLAGLEVNVGRCVTQHVALGTLWDSILALSLE